MNETSSQSKPPADEEASAGTRPPPLPPLSHFLNVLLLKDIEDSNTPRQQIDLTAICNAREDAFGARGSTTRRQVQLRWQKLKNRGIKSYVRLLEQYGVKPGLATQVELDAPTDQDTATTTTEAANQSTKTTTKTDESVAQATKKRSHSSKSKKNKKMGKSGDDSATVPSTVEMVEEQEQEESDDESSVSSSSSSDSSNSSSDDSSAKKKKKKSRKKSRKHIKKKKSKKSSRSVRSSRSKKQAEESNGDKKPAARGNAQSSMNFMSPPRVSSRASANDNESTYTFGETTSNLGTGSLVNNGALPYHHYCNQQGTMKQPWIVIVDYNRPERNMGFDIQWIEGIPHMGWKRDGYHIRRAICPLDIDKWEATIPETSGGLGPAFDDRLVLVKGPSQDYWFRDTNLYHFGPKEKMRVNCKVTADAHQMTQTAITADKKSDSNIRMWVYYLLIFPPAPNRKLANQIFSHDEDIVPKKTVPLKVDKNHKDNDIEKDVYGIVMYWRIAVRGGVKITEIEQKKESLYD